MPIFLTCPGISDHRLNERLAPDSEGAMCKARFTEEQMVGIIRARIASQCQRWPSGTVSASRRSTHCARVSSEWRYGKPKHSKFRDECLSLEWFRSRAEAKVIMCGCI